MQQEHEHHRLLEIHSQHSESDQQQSHTLENSSFVGQADPHRLPPPITSKHTKRAQDRTTQPPLWNTKEFYFYYLVFAYCVPHMFKTAHEASSGTQMDLHEKRYWNTNGD